eukprot:scaffold93176_cov89-Cyclotella_meneghiniana.AAC.2
MVLATVREEDDQLILETVYRPSMIWRTVNDTREIEMVLLERNSRHLKQAEIEEGRCHDETIRRMRKNQGTDLMDEILNGTVAIPDATDEIIVAWIQAHKQTEEELKLPKITGEITPEQLQKRLQWYQSIHRRHHQDYITRSGSAWQRMTR